MIGADYAPSKAWWLETCPCCNAFATADTRDLLQANAFSNGAAAFVPGFAQAAGASGVSVVGPGSGKCQGGFGDSHHGLSAVSMA